MEFCEFVQARYRVGGARCPGDRDAWTLDFATPQGQALTAGTTYDNVARYPFQTSTQPGLSLYGDGRGCNTVTGSFTVIFPGHQTPVLVA